MIRGGDIKELKVQSTGQTIYVDMKSPRIMTGVVLNSDKMMHREPNCSGNVGNDHRC